MSPGWLLLSLPGLALFGWMWWRCHRAVRALRDAPLLRLPLQAAQDFDLPTTGRLLVAGSYPRASIAFVRAQPRVSRAADGEPLPMQRPLANFDTRGAKGWAPLGHFDVEQPGRYRLEIVGIPTNATAANSPVLTGAIELETTGAIFFSDGNNLAAIFTDLLANPFPNNAFNIASTQFFNGSSNLGIQFGAASASAQFSLLPTNPNPEPPTTTPEPSALIAFIAALLAGSHLRKVH